MLRNSMIVAALASAILLAGCAGVKEAWLGVPTDLHEQLFSQRAKNEESPGLDWFGTVARSDLDSAHINAWWRDGVKLDSIDAEAMCITLINTNPVSAEKRKVAAGLVAELKNDDWAAGSATTLEAEYPPNTPWPKPPPADQVKVNTVSQTEKEGRWDSDHRHQFEGSTLTWTRVCVPAPKVTPETHFLTMSRMFKDKDVVSMILVWQIKG